MLRNYCVGKRLQRAVLAAKLFLELPPLLIRLSSGVYRNVYAPDTYDKGYGFSDKKRYLIVLNY